MLLENPTIPAARNGDNGNMPYCQKDDLGPVRSPEDYCLISENLTRFYSPSEKWTLINEERKDIILL